MSYICTQGIFFDGEMGAYMPRQVNTPVTKKSDGHNSNDGGVKTTSSRVKTVAVRDTNEHPLMDGIDLALRLCVNTSAVVPAEKHTTRLIYHVAD